MEQPSSGLAQPVAPGRPLDRLSRAPGSSLGTLLARGPQHRERVRDLERARAEAVDRGGTAARSARRAALAGRLEPPRRSRTRWRFVVETSWPSAAAYSVAQLRERELGRARARSRRSCTRAWRAGGPGRRGRSGDGRRRARAGASTGCQAVSAGTSGSIPPGRARGRRWRAAAARDGGRARCSVSSCSRCASSRTSTFAARWRRIERSSVSSRAEVPPGSAQRPLNGSRARCQSSTRSSPRPTCRTTASAVVDSRRGRLGTRF